MVLKRVSGRSTVTQSVIKARWLCYTLNISTESVWNKINQSNTMSITLLHVFLLICQHWGWNIPRRALWFFFCFGVDGKIVVVDFSAMTICFRNVFFFRTNLTTDETNAAVCVKRCIVQYFKIAMCNKAYKICICQQCACTKNIHQQKQFWSYHLADGMSNALTSMSFGFLGRLYVAMVRSLNSSAILSFFLK